MKIKNISDLVHCEEYNVWTTQKIDIKVLGSLPCVFVLQRFDPESDFEDFKTAIDNFISMKVRDYKESAEYLFQYYRDVISKRDLNESEIVKLRKSSDVWKNVWYNGEISVSRRSKDKKVYISVEGGCKWEEEHGLQIVFCEGKTLVKVGSYDSHLRNSDAYADPSLENVIYK